MRQDGNDERTPDREKHTRYPLSSSLTPLTPEVTSLLPRDVSVVERDQLIFPPVQALHFGSRIRPPLPCRVVHRTSVSLAGETLHAPDVLTKARHEKSQTGQISRFLNPRFSILAVSLAPLDRRRAVAAQSQPRAYQGCRWTLPCILFVFISHVLGSLGQLFRFSSPWVRSLVDASGIS